MPAQPPPPQAPAMGLADIYFIVFRHKWKIMICFLLGITGAVISLRLEPPSYESDAKMFIRYVLSDKQINAVGADEAKSPDQRGETIMNSEIEILTSTDVAKQVADAVGPEKILAKLGGGSDSNLAAAMIRKNLLVDVPPRSTVIHVVFRHPDPQMVQPVLRELIDRYMKMHREVHLSAGIVGDFLTQETDQLRARLAQTEDDLRKARMKAGIVSTLDDTKRTYSEQIASIRLEIFNAQAELAEKSSALKEAMKEEGLSTAPAPTPAAPAKSTGPTLPPPPAVVPSGTIDEYRGVVSRLAYLQKSESDLLVMFTPDSSRVKEIRAQINSTETKKKQLEHDYPGLLRTVVEPAAANVAAPLNKAVDFVAAQSYIAALQSKIKVLSGQLEQLNSEADKIGEVEVNISELNRRRELDELNYKHFSETLEQSRLDEALGNGRISNITTIEAPTPPASDATKVYKTPGMILFAGLALGLGWAFAIEMYLDRTIKRPIDVERYFRIPLFLCLPEVKALRLKKGKAAPKELPAPAAATAAPGDESPALPVPADGDPLRIYHETLRDRLIGFFESVNLTHKPKLVAVTSVGRSAGVTTTAAGLSQSLSEIGEGNVLLVDMTAGHGSARQFMKGKPVPDLDDLLASRDGSDEDAKLYVVAADSNSERLTRNLPQRFTKLVPKLKASDFDYIIFDMPPVSQISITPRLASFMDMVLVVIESEKTDRDVIERATTLLSQSKVHVGAVLNKARTYGPSPTHQEFLYGN